MFGYIRPYKPNLLMKEFSRYRAVYCGICKTISQEYGQVPRLSVSYDVTFLALFLLSLETTETTVEMDSCIVNPFQKKPILSGENEIIHFVAAVSVLLAWYKGRDDKRDEHPLKGRMLQLLFNRAKKKAALRYPDLNESIAVALDKLQAAESRKVAGLLSGATESTTSGLMVSEKFPLTAKSKPVLLETTEAVASHFGQLLGDVFAYGGKFLTLPNDHYLRALEGLGTDLGRWIYWLDAIDDWQKDRDNNEWNPFSYLSAAAAKARANTLLQAEEEAIDRYCALFHYQRDAAIMVNIVQEGLAAVRKQVLKGEKLGRI